MALNLSFENANAHLYILSKLMEIRDEFHFVMLWRLPQLTSNDGS